MVWRNACNKGSDAVSASAPLLHHRNIKTMDLYLSRLFLEFIGLTLVFFGLLFLFCLMGLAPWPEDLLLMMTAWLLMLWFALGYGLLFGSMMALFETFAIFWRVVNVGLFFISGVFFFVVWLPLDLRELVLWVPMIHGTEMLRHGYYGNLVQTFEDPLYLISWNLILSLLGFIAIRSSRLIDSMEQGSA
jgi:capsular polysaccharide transport system permease protein